MEQQNVLASVIQYVMKWKTILVKITGELGLVLKIGVVSLNSPIR